MNQGRRKPLGQSLVEQGHLSPEALARALEEQRRAGASLRDVLLRLDLAPESALLDYYEDTVGVPRMDLTTYILEPEIVRLVPERVARQFHVVPLFRIGNTITVAMADPLDVVARDEVKQTTGMEVDVVVSPEGQIREAIDRYHPAGGVDRLVRLGAPGTSSAEAEQRLEEDGPIIRFVNAIAQQATREGASDVHFEPEESSFRVRFRVDGVLREASLQSRELYASVVSRIKVMAALDIAERRMPQDGRIKLKLGANREMDFRVSVLPTIFGEKVVLRLLDKSNLQLDMTKLGFEEKALKDFKEAIYKPFGMVLVTGPTGSGKTTTLYSALAELNKISTNISTAEDPVEFNLVGINQVQMHEEIGLTFAASLRAFLRQDPDIIMVGEIRDFETAEIGVKAALTGHLVLSTLHTNDAPGTVSRLLNMGIEPFLVTASLNAIVAQRLCRRLCAECKKPATDVEDQALLDAGFSAEEIGTFQPMAPGGCKTCNDRGYKGRVAVYEVMPMWDGLKELVIQGCSAAELKQEAIRLGFRTLRMSALSKVKGGVTTLAEAVGNTAPDKF
jgi:type IV pilus assembly protein PilB